MKKEVRKGRLAYSPKLHSASLPCGYSFCWKVIDQWPGQIDSGYCFASSVHLKAALNQRKQSWEGTGETKFCILPQCVGPLWPGHNHSLLSYCHLQHRKQWPPVQATHEGRRGARAPRRIGSPRRGHFQGLWSSWWSRDSTSLVAGEKTRGTGPSPKAFTSNRVATVPSP